MKGAEIRLGFTPYFPFVTINSNNTKKSFDEGTYLLNQLGGFEVEVMKAVSRHLGFKVV